MCIRDRIRGALLDARQGTRRVQSVVGDLQAFSRPEQALDAPVDVERVLAASINMVRNQIRHRARLVKNFFPVPSARGSEAQLGQVFLNLLTNAADAIEAGDAAHNRIEIDLHAKEGRVVGEVTDTGTGDAPGGNGPRGGGEHEPGGLGGHERGGGGEGRPGEWVSHRRG
mgnify:CR=1 FL=1